MKSNRVKQIVVQLQDSIRVHSTRQPYVFQWPPLGVSTSGDSRSSSEQVWTGLRWWPPDVSSREGMSILGPMSMGYPLPCDLSHDTCDVTYLPLLWTEWWTDAYNNIPVSTVAGGKNKKAFQSSGNCSLADRCLGYIVNKFEHLGEAPCR